MRELRLGGLVGLLCVLGLSGCVTTLEATGVTSDAATLRATVSTQDAAVRVHFELATSAAGIGTAAATRTAATTFAANTASTTHTARVTGLAPATTYFYAACESAGSATATTCDSAVQRFTTSTGATTDGTVAEAPLPGLVTDGVVSAVARAGDTTYVGGTFERVGPRTGAAVALSTGGAQRDAAMPQVTGGDAQVDVVVPDGSGGWYLGGSFTRVGGLPRANLAHVRADRTVDPAFAPDPDGAVRAIAPAGATVYVGGSFATIGGVARRNLAELSAAGVPTAFAPTPDADVTTLAVLDAALYVGGAFTRIAGRPRVWAASFTRSDGALRAWDARITADGTAGMTAFLPRGDRVIVVGRFAEVAGAPHAGIAFVSAATGALSGPNPDLGETAWINDAELSPDGTRLYLAGWGTAFDSGVIALDPDSGAKLGWKAGVDYAGASSVAATATTVYAGWTTIDDDRVPRGSELAAFDAATGARTAWSPATTGSVHTLAVSGSTVFAGGTLRSAGMTRRPGLVGVDTRTGQATAFDPGVQQVGELAVGGGTLYVSGAFTTAAGQPRQRLAAFDTGTGALTAWNPGVDDGITRLLPAGDVVYAGGTFSRIGGQQRRALAAVDATTGRATSWDPNITQRGYGGALISGGIGGMALSGTTLYIGGSFTGTGPVIGASSVAPRTNLAAISTTTGAATAWRPELPAPNDYVTAMAVDGTTVYIGGTFTHVAGQPRNHLAALTTTGTGTLLPFDPSPDNEIRDLAVLGSTLYAGGIFGKVGGVPRRGVAGFALASGTLRDWDPGLASFQPMVTRLAVSGGSLSIGGDFAGTDRTGQAPWASFGPAE